MVVSKLVHIPSIGVGQLRAQSFRKPRNLAYRIYCNSKGSVGDSVHCRTFAAPPASKEVSARLRAKNTGMPRTVIVEPHPTGHRFQHVSHVARLATDRGDDVELLTSSGVTSRDEYQTFLGDLQIRVHDRLAGFFPPAREVCRALAELHQISPIDTLVVLDADQALKRWWVEVPWALRRRSGPTKSMLLMRYPQGVSLSDRTLVAMKASKFVLSLLARLTGAADRIAYLGGRHEARSGWVLQQVRDPAICLAHSRDRAMIRRRLDLPLDRRLVGIVGEISIRKCVPMVAEAVRMAGDDVDLLLAGGITADMKEWLEGLPEADRARVHTRLGFLPDEEMDACVAACDAISIAMLNPGPSGIQGKALLAGVPTLSAGSRLRERESTSLAAGLHTNLDVPSLAAGLRQLLSGYEIPHRALDNVPTAEEFAAVMLGAHFRAANHEAVR